jgi:hypothetical protein
MYLNFLLGNKLAGKYFVSYLKFLLVICVRYLFINFGML